MKIGDIVIATEGFAGLDFSYGVGDENNPATYIEVTKANIGHLQDAEDIGRIKIIKTSEESPPAESEPETKVKNIRRKRME